MKMASVVLMVAAFTTTVFGETTQPSASSAAPAATAPAEEDYRTLAIERERLAKQLNDLQREHGLAVTRPDLPFYISLDPRPLETINDLKRAMALLTAEIEKVKAMDKKP